MSEETPSRSAVSCSRYSARTRRRISDNGRESRSGAKQWWKVAVTMKREELRGEIIVWRGKKVNNDRVRKKEGYRVEEREKKRQ